MSILKIKDKNGNWISMPTIEGNAGETVNIDQSYNPQSENAQSGKAVAEAIKDKVDKEDGKGLSVNDFTNEYKEKLDDLQIDQTYNPESENAQSGIAIEQINSHIEYINSDGTHDLYSLDTGTYVLNGSVLLSPNTEIKTTTFNYYLVSVRKYTSRCCIMYPVPGSNSYNYFKIYSDGSYVYKTAKLNFASVWRKINELTLEEDSVVSITEDSDGNGFSLNGLRVHLTIPATESGVTPWLHCNGKGFCQAASVGADKIGMVYYLAELKGLWTCDTSTLANAEGNSNTLINRYGFVDGTRKESSHSDPVTSIKLSGGYSGTLPTGTVIEVWGLDY